MDLHIKQKNNLLVLMYIISTTIAFSNKIGNIIIPSYIQYIIFAGWIFIAIFKFKKNNFKLKTNEIPIKHFFIIFLLPRISIHIYSLILFMIGKTNYLTRNTQTYLIVLSVFAILYIFNINAIKYTIISMVLSYLIVLIFNIFIYGIDIIPKCLMYLINGSYVEVGKLFEIHDYVFAIGYIILFYILIKEKFTKLDLVHIYIFTISLIFGMKRIQVLALFLILVYSGITLLVRDKFKLYKFTSYCYVAVSFLFIYLLSNGVFFNLLNSLGINTMGRIYYYEKIISLCKFSPTFLGFGRNAVTNLLTTEYSYLNVAGVHSDILKYFAECGLILFGIWMWYYLIKVVKWIKYKYSFSMLKCYYILTLYTFIIFYTDNIDVYFISQFIYMLLIGGMGIYDKTIKDSI